MVLTVFVLAMASSTLLLMGVGRSTPVVAGGDAVLLETGDQLLLETGDALLLE